MALLFVPPRHVDIGDAASFVGTTVQEIRHYQELGLLAEPERGSDDRPRYGHDEVIRLLWIRTMADAGIALDDIRNAFADGDHDVAGMLTLKMGLLSDFVTDRFTSLPEGSLRTADLDTLLVIERMFGPLGAAVNASRYIALATHPALREQSDRVEAAEEALDDTIAVDDPRVAEVAAERHAFELALRAVTEAPGMAESEDALFDAWDTVHSETASGGPDVMSAVDAAEKMPYNFSPARLRCLELTEELIAHDSPAP
jgi:DNA-binding transcriptional MerR regulator